MKHPTNRIQMMELLVQPSNMKLQMGELSKKEYDEAKAIVESVMEEPGWLPVEPETNLINNLMMRLDHSVGLSMAVPDLEVPSLGVFEMLQLGNVEAVRSQALNVYEIIFNDALSGDSAINECRSTSKIDLKSKIQSSALQYVYSQVFLNHQWRKLPLNDSGFINVTSDSITKLETFLLPQDVNRMLEEISEKGFYRPFPLKNNVLSSQKIKPF